MGDITITFKLKYYIKVQLAMALEVFDFYKHVVNFLANYFLMKPEFFVNMFSL